MNGHHKRIVLLMTPIVVILRICMGVVATGLGQVDQAGTGESAMPPLALSAGSVREVGGDRVSPWRSDSEPHLAAVIADVHHTSTRLCPLPSDRNALGVSE